jgi:hypothetical protein
LSVCCIVSSIDSTEKNAIFSLQVIKKTHSVYLLPANVPCGRALGKDDVGKAANLYFYLKIFVDFCI